MNVNSIKSLLINLKDLFESFFKNALIIFLLGVIVSLVITSLNNPYYYWLINVALGLVSIIVIYLIYYARKIYVSINYNA